tara:strand:+ start:136 stop:441 length:306 start_codon:yes stop_codon:yes gene_type:complete
MSKFEMWLDSVNQKRKEHWDKNYSYKAYTPLEIKKGNKYIKVIDNGSVWAFVSMIEGVNKGSLVCIGDLLKPAGWNTPAKHSRGNIFDGSDKWSFFGPTYL